MDGAQINWNGRILISKGFNLCASRRVYSGLDRSLPSKWYLIELSLLNFLHCSRLMKTHTFMEFTQQALGCVYTLKSK